jgi:CheY-like chemotaxis protein
MVTDSKNLYKHLLIIDDDVEDQEIFIEALHEVDPSVACDSVVSGEDAFNFLEANRSRLPELIFLDMNMPKLNGKQVLKEIKKSEVFSRIPVIMYSTSFAPRDIEEIRQLGAVYHLFKPSKFDDLCNSLKHLISVDWLHPEKKKN